MSTAAPLPAGAVSIRDGVLYGPGGATYRFTAEDKLWLGRALLGESGTSRRGGAAVAWAMATNFMTRGPRGGPRFARLPTFTHLLRAYCQPINPIWATLDGRGCQRLPRACTPRHLARRAQITGTPWEGLPVIVRELVEAFLAGRLENPVPGATDWATPRWGADNVEIDGNFFGRKA